jgi:F-type H+-transporting ATPase subunit b
VPTHSAGRSTAVACETWRKAVAAVCRLTVSGALLMALGAAAHLEPGGAALSAAPAHAPDGPRAAPDGSRAEADATHEAVAEGHTAEGEHEESIWGFVGKLFNFAILAGTLIYLFRAPIAGYLDRRGGQIRSDLEAARAMEATAAQQIADITARLQQLPSEIEALRARGSQEIAAEEARIQAEAEAERDRLLEQTRREIDLQLRVAKRELVNHAADLAVGVARERIKGQITDADQAALVDRYLSKVNAGE